MIPLVVISSSKISRSSPRIHPLAGAVSYGPAEWNMSLDFVGEFFYYIIELLYMLWPDKKDRWVIPIATGLSVLVIAFVALALFMQ
jgi:hypothetical protein